MENKFIKPQEVRVVVEEVPGPMQGRRENASPVKGRKKSRSPVTGRSSSKEKRSSLFDKERLLSDSGTSDLVPQLQRPEDVLNTREVQSDHSDASSLSQMSVISAGSIKTRGVRKRKERQSPNEDDYDTVSTDGSAPVDKLAPSKRKRGRPPDPGFFVGLAKKKERANKAMKEEIDLINERQMAAKLSKFIERDEHVRGSLATMTGDELIKEVEGAVDLINEMEKKSRNLKGTYKRSLKAAAAKIMQAITLLSSRTVDEEISVLRKENEITKRNLEDIRKEFAEFKARAEQAHSDKPPPSTVDRQVDEFRASLILDVGRMMDAKLAGITDRLLPEKRLRPPLAADRQSFDQSDLAIPGPSGVSSLKPSKTYKAAPSRAAKSVSGRAVSAEAGATCAPRQTAAASKPTPAKSKAISFQYDVPTPAPEPQPSDVPWTEVVKRGSKKKKKPQSTPVVASLIPAAKAAAKGKKKRGRGKKKAAPRKSADVIAVTVPEEAKRAGHTYEGLLAQARQAIPLKELGIEQGFDIRRAITGGCILEVRGGGAEKADAFAAKLREIAPAGVKIDRPVRRKEIRLTGLDDSITRADILVAVAETGKCPPEQVRVRDIRVGFYGTGTVTVLCPEEAALLLAQDRLLIGWSSCRVHLLEARPLTCFRCLEVGHTGSQCRGEDRTNVCYRCGKSGHKAATCSEQSHCPACEKAGRPSNHQIGSDKCPKPKREKRTIWTRTPRLETRPVAGAMETV